jgi:carboxyl-terminal processing protease
MRRLLIFSSLTLVLFQSAVAQQLEKHIETSRANGLKMLKTVKQQIEENYYDPNFHGLDLDARFAEAEARIKTATTQGQVIGIIAQAVVDLNDSHTRLVPPLRGGVVVYGWRMQMIGDKCYITGVMRGSDAEAKGLRVGDRILALDGVAPTRDTMWKIKYYYYSLRPKSSVRVTLQTGNETKRDVEVTTKYFSYHTGYFTYEYNHDLGPELGNEETPDVLYEEIGDLIICRLDSFRIDDGAVNTMMKRISRFKKLIFDLRRNPGGYSRAVDRTISYFFDHEVKVADLKMRNETKEDRVKPQKSNIFSGELIVLIDSESTSAAEIFARVMQLEKRGRVIGDISGGRVMQSIRFSSQLDSRDLVVYGMMITRADLIMSDGKSLEWTGVTPDTRMVPTAEDIRDGRDPVLAYAVSLAGVTMTPEKAGALFGNARKTH